MKRTGSFIFKTIAFSAFTSMIFHLSLFIINPVIDCKDICKCGCAETEIETAAAEIAYSSCCSPQKVVKVTKGCCEKEKGAHENHITSSKNNNFRNIQCDLRSSVFNVNIFTEISGIASDKRLLPVEIVYFIFKPPIT